MVNGQFVDPMEIYVPEGASVAAKVEKTTLPADEQAAIIPAERIAAAPTQHQTQVEPVPLLLSDWLRLGQLRRPLKHQRQKRS